MGIRSASVVLVILGLVFSSASLRAAPVQAEVAALRTAYLDLLRGDHDYKGHRVKALRQVEAACRLLGLDVSGDGKARQPQASSDAALRDAQTQLQAVRSAAAANGQKELQMHCDDAIKQISIALTIK